MNDCGDQRRVTYRLFHSGDGGLGEHKDDLARGAESHQSLTLDIEDGLVIRGELDERLGSGIESVRVGLADLVTEFRIDGCNGTQTSIIVITLNMSIAIIYN